MKVSWECEIPNTVYGKLQMFQTFPNHQPESFPVVEQIEVRTPEQKIGR
jgi:hypothetical protein